MSPLIGLDFHSSGCSFVHCATRPAMSDRGVSEPSMAKGPNAPKSGPSSSGRQRQYNNPFAPPAHETRFQMRTSSASGIRPSSFGRPITCGCIQSGPPSASACQNGLPRAPARTRSIAWNCLHGSSPLRAAIHVSPHTSTFAAERHSLCERVRHVVERAGHTMRTDTMMWVELANEVYPPVEQTVTHCRCGTGASRDCPHSRRTNVAAPRLPTMRSCSDATLSPVASSVP